MCVGSARRFGSGRLPSVARIRPRSTRYKPQPYRERKSLFSPTEFPAACQQGVSNLRQNEDNRVQPAELQSGPLPPDVHPGRIKSAALAGSTSWGSLVRAQYRPLLKDRPARAGLYFGQARWTFHGAASSPQRRGRDVTALERRSLRTGLRRSSRAIRAAPAFALQATGGPFLQSDQPLLQ
jgi:hypothetical protein